MLLCNVLQIHVWRAAHAHMACAVGMDLLKMMTMEQQIAVHVAEIEEVIHVA